MTTLSPTSQLEVFKRFSSITQSQNSLFLSRMNQLSHKRGISQSYYQKAARSTNKTMLLNTDRSNKHTPRGESNKTLQLMLENQRSENILHLKEWIRKLLNDVQGYERQVKGLKGENERLRRQVQKMERGREEIARRRLGGEGHQFECQEPGKYFENKKARFDDYSEMEEVETTHFDPATADMRMIISRRISFSQDKADEEENKYEEQIKAVTEQNAKLKEEIRLLVLNLEKHRKQQTNLSKKQKPTPVPTESIQTQTPTTSSPPQQPKNKTLREVQLQNKVHKLESHIKEVQSHHNRLKDRCNNIKQYLPAK